MGKMFPFRRASVIVYLQGNVEYLDCDCVFQPV